MVIAKFYRSVENRLLGFEITGHAGYDVAGSDIVCAAVSSAVMLTCNMVTDVFGVDAKVQVAEDLIMLKLVSDKNGDGDKLVLGLMAHLELVSQDYPGCIQIKEIIKQL